MNRFLCFVMLAGGLLGTLTAQAYEERNLLQKQTSETAVKEMLVMDRKWVQYPDYRNREAWDAFLGEYKPLLIRNGEQLLDYQWQVVKASDYLEYERSGNRQIMERPFGNNNQAIVRLLLAELAEGKGRFMDQLINGVFHACEMTSWALSAHLPKQPDRRSLPCSTYHLIDLTAGDLGGLLSWVYYFMHDEFDKVNPEISRRLYSELNDRILTPYIEDDGFWWMAVHYKGQLVNNWNPWCNSNALMSFMLLENDRDRLAKAVWRSMQSVDKFLNYVKADGACEEGPSYWGHASGKLLDYLELLADITGGRINIFQEKQVKSMGEYISRSYVGNGWVVNFADASAKGGGDAYLIYRYGRAVDSDELKQFAASLLQGKKISFSGRDVYRMLKALVVRDELAQMTPSHDVPSCTWYPETEFYYAQRGAAFLAAKGGFNNESHNHNDVGSCSLWLNQVPMLIDAGVGTYTRQTFSNERYSIWTMQSDYHNLPIINGCSQRHGNAYKARAAKAAEGSFSVDIAAAYPQEAGVRQWIRSYRLGRNMLTVQDNFRLESATEKNRVNFLTWGDVQPGDGYVEITVEGAKARLYYDVARFEMSKETVELPDPRLSKVWGKEIYRLSFTARKVEQNGKYTFTLTY